MILIINKQSSTVTLTESLWGDTSCEYLCVTLMKYDLTPTDQEMDFITNDSL